MVIYCIVIVITISHFFARLQVVLYDITYAALGLSAILEQATERLGYDWEYYTGNLGQHTTTGCQFYIRFTNGANGGLVGYIYGRPCHRSFEARESPIVRALAFIDGCGYRIRDINYHAWMQMYGATHAPLNWCLFRFNLQGLSLIRLMIVM